MQLDGSFIYQSINQSIRQSINQSMSYTIVTNRIQKFWNSPVPLQVVFFFNTVTCLPVILHKFPNPVLYGWS